MSAAEESREPLAGFSLSSLRDVPARELVIRFVFGALISTIAGLIALGFGVRAAGLLLAFPAILPATLTLIEEDESRTKAEDDDIGAVLGAAALIAFALIARDGLDGLGAPVALVSAAAGWLALAVLLYLALRGLADHLGCGPRTVR